MKRINRPNVVILAMIMGTILAVSSLLANPNLINSAAAAPNKILQGSTPFPSSQGSNLICPDGTTVQANSINFVGNRMNSGSLHFQSWSFSIHAFFAQLFGQGNIVQISPSNFKLKGIMSGDDVCNATVPTTVSLSGQCGNGVTVKFETGSGIRATFNGINVACQG